MEGGTLRVQPLGVPELAHDLALLRVAPVRHHLQQANKASVKHTAGGSHDAAARTVVTADSKLG